VWLWRQGRAVPWAACGVATFLLLLAAVHQVLPGYARRFSMRGQVRPHAELCAASLPVACYPRRWDSVSFYLRRDDVGVWTAGQRRELVARLRKGPALLFVKSGRHLEEFLRDLPPSLEFVPRGRRGNATVGVVRARRAVGGLARTPAKPQAAGQPVGSSR
jgi:hypothetical protein